jgi:hypothetical protein
LLQQELLVLELMQQELLVLELKQQEQGQTCCQGSYQFLSQTVHQRMNHPSY